MCIRDSILPRCSCSLIQFILFFIQIQINIWRFSPIASFNILYCLISNCFTSMHPLILLQKFFSLDSFFLNFYHNSQVLLGLGSASVVYNIYILFLCVYCDGSCMRTSALRYQRRTQWANPTTCSERANQRSRLLHKTRAGRKFWRFSTPPDATWLISIIHQSA